MPVYAGSYTATKALNINNGGSWIINRELVRMILKSDSDLAQEFEDAKRKNKKLESFIIKYSLKHKDEIK